MAVTIALRAWRRDRDPAVGELELDIRVTEIYGTPLYNLSSKVTDRLEVRTAQQYMSVAMPAFSVREMCYSNV